MVLQLLGLITIVIFTIFVVRTASENGRNGLVWGVACAGVGFGLQWIIPIAMWVIIGVALTVAGNPPDRTIQFANDWALLVTVAFLALSVLGMFLILRKTAQLPDDDASEPSATPPPPSFESHD